MAFLKLLFILSSLPIFGYFEQRYEGLSILWQSAWDQESRLDIIKQFLPENPIIFEAGGYDGTHTLIMAKYWPNGQIISFEPNPNAFKKQQEKIKNYQNVSSYQLAVNSYNGFSQFYLCWGTGGKDPIFEGASSLLKAAKHMENDYQGPMITVPCVILDDWCRKRGTKQIDFMWLDLEGFELQFLNSSPEILQTVQVIYTETNLQALREGMTLFSDLSSFLKEKGFTIIAHWFFEGYQGDAIFIRNNKL